MSLMLGSLSTADDETARPVVYQCPGCSFGAMMLSDADLLQICLFVWGFSAANF